MALRELKRRMMEIGGDEETIKVFMLLCKHSINVEINQRPKSS